MTATHRRLLAHAVVVGVILALAATARAGDETCERYTPVPPHEPTGIRGCVIYGEGIASRNAGVLTRLHHHRAEQLHFLLQQSHGVGRR